MDDPVNVVLSILFVAACIYAVQVTIRLPLEHGDPFAEAYGDQPELPDPAKRGKWS